MGTEKVMADPVSSPQTKTAFLWCCKCTLLTTAEPYREVPGPPLMINPEILVSLTLLFGQWSLSVAFLGRQLGCLVDSREVSNISHSMTHTLIGLTVSCL